MEVDFREHIFKTVKDRMNRMSLELDTNWVMRNAAYLQIHKNICQDRVHEQLCAFYNQD